MIRKDKIILQLEQKIRSQESTIQDVVVGSARTTRSRSVMKPAKEELEKIEVHHYVLAVVIVYSPSYICTEC